MRVWASEWRAAPRRDGPVMDITSGLALFADSLPLQQVAIDTGDRRGKISVTVVAIVAASFLYGGAGTSSPPLFALTRNQCSEPIHESPSTSERALATQGAAGHPRARRRPGGRVAVPDMALPHPSRLVYYAVNQPACARCVASLSGSRRGGSGARTSLARALLPRVRLLALVSPRSCVRLAGSARAGVRLGHMQVAMRQYADSAGAASRTSGASTAPE